MPKNELYHYGIKGMKWGVRRNRLQSAIDTGVKKRIKNNSERFKDTLASRDPIANANRERQKKRAEASEITQAKGKAKVVKILAKIGNDLLNPTVVDGPVSPTRKPWDEKPHRDRGGNI